MWTVWGDGKEPVAVDLTYEDMKDLVDNDQMGTYYGVEDHSGEEYEG